MPTSDFYPNNVAGTKGQTIASNLPVSQGDGPNFPNSLQMIPTFSSVIIDRFMSRFKLKSLFKTEEELGYENGKRDIIMIPNVDLDGIYDYPRGAVIDGHTPPNIKSGYDVATWDYLRSCKVAVDTLDYENSVLSSMKTVPLYLSDMDRVLGRQTLIPEVVGKQTAKLLRLFFETQLADDLTVYTINKLSANAGTIVNNEDLNTTEDVLSALSLAANTMAENSVPYEERILYITPTLIRLARAGNKLTNENVLDEFSEIVQIPQQYMYTLAEKVKVNNLPDGKYVPSTNSKQINFLAVSKHATLVAAETRDWAYSGPTTQVAAATTAARVRAIAHVYETRKQGVYVSISSTTATAPTTFKAGGDNAEYPVKIIDRAKGKAKTAGEK